MKRDVGFSVRVFVACALVFAGTLSFSGCQNDLLESPSFQNRGSYSTGRVAAPTNVTATQGGFRSITLKWTAAKSAVLYNIYSSDTATGNFTFLEQTPDATCSYTLSENPDVKKYYKIQSVDSNGEVSELYSQICFGTTLATPIITSIKQNANGDEITVRWYKGVNCTTDTYLNSGLIYTVVLYNADGTQVIKEETISAMDVKEAADTKYTFKNLTPNTEYCIQIKAYTKAAQDSKSTENSDILNQSTAHSLIPAAPENFAVSKGTSKDQVTLSWTLPKFAEIKSSTAFETRPVYFKIYRKLESAPENAYEPIVSYLGTTELKENEKPAKTAIHFTKKEAGEGSDPTAEIKYGESLAASKTTDSEEKEIEIPAKIEIISIEYPKDDAETDVNYPNYIPGTKITLSDKTVSRGQKYTYRIQSFIDDSKKKNVTSDESYSDETGWLINSPTVSVSSTYKENEKDENLIDSFTVTLNFKFDDFGQPYNYVITETCQKMKKATAEEIEEGKQDYPDPDSPATETHPNSTSYSNFFPWTATYEPLDEENTYLLYTYDIAVCPKDSGSDDSNHYIKVSAPGSVIVINDKSMIPDVSSFKVEDGYKDKFKLSWIYDKNCKYILTWKNTDKNGTETQGEYEFQESDFIKNENQIENKTEFTYDHKAESGDIRTEYTLNADNGLKNHETKNEEFKTLGTPEPYFEPAYDSIKVIWQAVQKADSSKYEAKYKFGPNEAITIAAENVKTDDDGKTFYCEIQKPYGETTSEELAVDNTTDASIAGSNITFTLTAASDVDNNNSSIDIATLGPANLDLKVTGDRNLIQLQWNKVKGAKGYLIFRKKYINEYFSNEENKGDLYYYETDSENGTISLIGADATAAASCTQTAGRFTFTDKYQSINLTEDDLKNQYKTDQAQIKWGIRYGYTVIPVLNPSDFEFNDDYSIKGSKIAYTDTSLEKVEKSGATYGYGLALTASKATTNDKVKLSWKPPYNNTAKPTVFYRNYNAANGSTWNQETDYIGLSTDSTTECSPKIPYKAYDYLVYYNIEGKPDIDPYYEYFISQRTDSDDEKENKGYIFSFATPTATYAGKNDVKDSNYYAEKFTWQTFGDEGFNIYDTTERKKKPDSIQLFMLNTNKAVGWQQIAEINPETLKATVNAATCNTYDLDIDTTDAYSITVAPNGIKNNGAANTDGLLKVLRDAKHYYKVQGSRKDGEATIYTEVGTDGSIFAYRQITDEELVKATMLVIADAFNKTSQGSTTNGTTGSFWWDSKYSWDFDAWYKLKMKINDYIVSWTQLPNNNLIISNLPACIKISAPNNSNDTMGSAWDKKPYFLCTGDSKNFNISNLIPLTIENTNIPLSSYSGTVNFAAFGSDANEDKGKANNSQFSVTVEHNGSEPFNKDVSGDEVKRWFPAKIGNNPYTGDSSDYGWWED